MFAIRKSGYILRRTIALRSLTTATRHTLHQVKQTSSVNEVDSSTSRLYTVRPVTFWMDRILEKENKRPLTEEETPHEHKLLTKTMADSYMEEYLPFQSSPALLEEYVSSGGKIRIGKMLEDLDALAGAIAYKHVDTNPLPPGPPVTIVTASVDRLELLLPAQVGDLKLSGHVTYVGKSMFVKVDTIPGYDPSAKTTDAVLEKDFMAKPTSNTVLFARFTMVAKNSATGKSIQVNPLELNNAEEKKLFKFAEDSKMRKRLAGEMALSKAPPTAEERLDIHDLYIKYSNFEHKKEMLPKDTVWMEDTTLQSVFLMQPQDRNIHNNIFGGYLMRRAYELAHATGCMFVKSQVNLRALDEIVFSKPVPVGAFLNLSSQVIYAKGDPHRSFQVSVTAEVNDIEKNTSYVTNTFHFTLESLDNSVPNLLPRTYAESMRYIEGKRRREQGIKARKSLLDLMQHYSSSPLSASCSPSAPSA
ncbi:Acyl-coenzyme A thioesterase 9, mitochondrial [Apophysomyces ossiformis]|uniref:Acyl-coenzyme A thioesterase 9, mitochondrial n=1 Tax=Apophysomyces ossiformis TaxID=679940 RepID=A0A8H7BPR1_9FUNG|nr:Acyl-coenzyme A thioesterase 9, mitochondrial [Apophysomyces ossiformis]